MTFTPDDTRWMRRALLLAGRGFTPPNPMVGCVIVRNGISVGEGFHPKAGDFHAEVFALRAAGSLAAGATAYVTLEPCCHQGRTPPCTSALIRSGVSRVVVAMQDPNPLVSGKGINQLRAAGILVEVGLMAQQSTRLNEAFIHFHTHGLPFVTLKVAATLDGKIATRTGASRWITGPAARQRVHKLRAQSGAVMVGIGTVLADDPELSSRLSPRPPRQPVRIIIDSRLRTPVECRLVNTASPDMPVLIVTTPEANEVQAEKLRRPGLEVIRTSTPAAFSRVDLRQAMATLAARDIISILVEGGGELNAGMIAEGCADRVLMYLAPKLFCGASAPTAFEGIGAAAVDEAISVGRMKVARCGDDLEIQADVIRR